MIGLPYAFAIAVAVGQPPVKAPKPISEGRRIELKALEARRSFTSGIVQLRAKLKATAPTGRIETDTTYRIEFSGHFIRSERKDNRFGARHRNIYTGLQYIFSDNAAGDDIRIQDKNIATVSAKYGLLHPQLVGCYPMPLATSAHHEQNRIEDILGQPDRTAETVKSEKLDGVAVKHITYRRSNGVKLELWIAPGRNYAVLKIRVEGTSGHSTIRSVCKKYPKGIWFPSKVTFRRYSAKQKRIVDEETITISAAKFNQPISLDRFSLKTLGLKPGTAVTKNGRRMIWNGERLVDP